MVSILQLNRNFSGPRMHLGMKKIFFNTQITILRGVGFLLFAVIVGVFFQSINRIDSVDQQIGRWRAELHALHLADSKLLVLSGRDDVTTKRIITDINGRLAQVWWQITPANNSKTKNEYAFSSIRSMVAAHDGDVKIFCSPNHACGVRLILPEIVVSDVA